MKDKNFDFKTRLRRLGLTQKQLSEMVGLNYQSVRNALSLRDLSPWRLKEWNDILDRYEAEKIKSEAKEDT